ncbi:MAG TPA: hypothetical protein VKU85_19430, partial [bacterium]|nr:hypothetical protein [bacterium]
MNVIERIQARLLTVAAVAACTAAVTASAQEAPRERAAADAKAAAAASSESAEPEDSLTMQGGEDGTVFKSLTVTGEDRIRIDFQRPDLRLDLDPRTAPGLEWGDPMQVLAQPGVDLVGPLPALSSDERSPFLPRPWIDRFRTDEVVRFRPAMEGVENWSLIVADSRSDTVAVFQGKGNPPEEIAWNGVGRDGNPVPPGVTCSYVLQAMDKAGNHRSFVGEGFRLPAYRVSGGNGETLMFPASEIGAAVEASPVVGEVVSRLNTLEPAGGPVEVRVTASTFADAE